jgi:hypothetical protein
VSCAGMTLGAIRLTDIRLAITKPCYGSRFFAGG